MHIYMCICIYACICTYVHRCVYVCVFVYIFFHICKKKPHHLEIIAVSHLLCISQHHFLCTYLIFFKNGNKLHILIHNLLFVINIIMNVFLSQHY